MDTVELYRKHAEECWEMARLIRDPESKASWKRIADRWLRCAELEAGRIPPARAAASKPRRRPIYRQAS